MFIIKDICLNVNGWRKISICKMDPSSKLILEPSHMMK